MSDAEFTRDKPLEIESPRLRLRDLREGDAERIAGMFSEPVAAHHILSKQRDRGHMRGVFERRAQHAETVQWHQRIVLSLAVELKDDSTLLGICDARFQFGMRRYARFGWHFSSAWAGKGYASEAVSRLMRLCARTHGIDCFVADCFASNAASRRVIEKLGLRPVGPQWFYRRYLSRKYREPVEIIRYKRHVRRGEELKFPNLEPARVADVMKPVDVDHVTREPGDA